MALDAVGLQQPLRYDVDIKSSLIRTPMTSQLMKGDRQANRVIVAIKDGKENVDLSGATVTGSFIRPPDDAEIPLVGIVSGNEAIVVLEDICYAQEGYCEISVMLTVGSTSRTILTLTGHVLSKGSGAVIDVGGVIPNINDIIAQYDEMKRVTQATQAAANAANEAASRAPYVGANGNWFVWNAASGSYIDSGSKAQGPTGPQGPGAEIDDTLSQSGKAADAKKTGEALSSLSEQIGDEWTAEKNYAAGDYSIHGNRLYKCKTAHTSGSTFNESYWQVTNASKELTPIYSRVVVGTTDSDGDLMTSFYISEWAMIGAVCLRNYGDGTYTSFFTAIPSGESTNSGCALKVVSDTMTALKNTKVAIKVFLIRTKNVENV